MAKAVAVVYEREDMPLAQMRGGQLVRDRLAELKAMVMEQDFDDLGSRKRLSRTHFLEVSRKGLAKKFDDADAFDPRKCRS